MLEKPVVEWTVILELERADGMRDAFECVRLAVGVVVARVDAPRLARARVLDVQDAVEHGIAQVDIAVPHVDLGAQHTGAIWEVTSSHAPEEVEVLGHRAVTERAVAAGLLQRAAGNPHLLGALVVDVGVAGLDQADGPDIELLEIVGGMIKMRAPIEAEPRHVRLDGVDVGLLLLGRVGVIHAQVAAAAELLGDAEVEADRLRMPHVQVAVRLRRKAGDDRVVPAGIQVRLDDIADEVASGRLVCAVAGCHVCHGIKVSSERGVGPRLHRP